MQKLDIEILKEKTAKFATKCELNFDNKIALGYILNNSQKITYGKLVAVK